MEKRLTFIWLAALAGALTAVMFVSAPATGGQSQRGQCQQDCTRTYQDCRRAANANHAACQQTFNACREACRNNANGNTNGNTNTNTNGNTNTNTNVNGNTNDNTGDHTNMNTNGNTNTNSNTGGRTNRNSNVRP